MPCLLIINVMFLSLQMTQPDVLIQVLEIVKNSGVLNSPTHTHTHSVERDCKFSIRSYLLAWRAHINHLE